MNGLWHSLIRLDWSDPRVVGIFIGLGIALLARKMSFVILLVLVIALGEGLNYMLAHSSLAHEAVRGIVIGVYALGGLVLLFLAIAHAFTRE